MIVVPGQTDRHILHLHRHLSLNCRGRWSTTDNITTSFSIFSTALWNLVNSRPVHSLMSSHLFFCLPCLLPPFTVPYKMVLARPDERETRPYHRSLRLFTIVRRSFCGPIACWILAQTSADAEIKVPPGENTELKRSSFGAWSRSVYSHASYAYCQGFLPR